MRTIILIAAMALTSAAAQAGETRNLSTAAAPSDAPATIQTKQLQAQNDAPVATPAKPADTSRYAPPPSVTQTPTDPARNISDAPRNTARPAPVDNAPPTAASTAPSTVTPSTAQPERRYDDKGYYDDAGYHPFPRRHTSDDRRAGRPHGYADRPHHRARWSARRIIAELRRYGIYW
jgi:hypothetical protein